MAFPSHVLITVDVETRNAVGDPWREIWGRLPGETEAFGIERQIEIMAAAGIEATFYLDVYGSAAFGDEAYVEAARAIAASPHELALHTHPKPMFGYHNMRRNDLALQTQIMTTGLGLLRDWTGQTARSHRAGAYAANLDTLRACVEAGIGNDSSFSRISFAGVPDDVAIDLLPLRHDGIVSTPVSYYHQLRFGPWSMARQVDLESASLDELKLILRSYRDDGAPSLTVMLHSFSLVRFGRPDRSLARKLADLCAFIEDEPGLVASGVSRFVETWRDAGCPCPSAPRVPCTGLLRGYRRILEDRYKSPGSRALAWLPPGPLVLGYQALRRR